MKKKKQINILIDDEEYFALRDIAEERIKEKKKICWVTTIVKELVTKYLKRQKGKNDRI